MTRALGEIRTPDLLIRSQMLYPLSYERTSIIIAQPFSSDKRIVYENTHKVQ